MRRKKISAILLAAFVGAGLMLSACSSGSGTGATFYEVSNYQGATKNEGGRTEYNKSLFYANYNQYGNPDPFVLDNTSRDGYYYLYATDSYMRAWRSENLTEWEDIGTTLNAGLTGTDADSATRQDVWASEVVYDESTRTYYMYFSASPAADNSVQDGLGAYGPMNETLHSKYNMYVASSSSPTGPFNLVDFTNPADCGENNLHDYNTTTGIVITDENRNNYKTTVVQDEVEYARAFPQYYSKYLAFDPEDFIYAYEHAYDAENYSVPMVLNGGTLAAIDPHPFVDPDTNKKYLYFVCDKASGQVGLAVVEMENWLKPKWDTFRFITHPCYYTVEDYLKANRDNEKVTRVTYENSGNQINEGPSVMKHNGKYYLSFSVNGYATSGYQVGQAVADSPLGPFRKLTEEEGGVLLSALTVESQPAGDTSTQAPSGTGHHSFVTVGNQTFIIYHRHKDYEVAGVDRYTAIDEIKWVTNDEGLEVMYANGPTDSIQPLPEAYSKYKNIAGEAKVSADSAATYVEALTDGLLSMQKTYGFADFVKETIITKTTTFTFDFSDAKAICAIMIYNSKDVESVFRNARVEFTCEQADGTTITKVIRNLEFDIAQYCSQSGFSGKLTYVMSGSAAFSEFYELKAKSVKITVNVPDGQSKVGLSEIRILGR